MTLGSALRLGRILGVLVLIGAVVVGTGIIPLRASSGHLPVTRWLLRFVRERSVDTHSLGTHVPPLRDPGLLVRGATHYESGCSPCHGSPTTDQGPVARRMTPRPPRFPAELKTHEPEDLFYLVKHGVKLTGMPAWPTLQRDDEVWAVVALLGAFPELPQEAYRRLAFGEGGTAPAPDPGDPVMEDVLGECARCHGVDGLGRPGTLIPALAGQERAYLAASLRAFAAGRRFSGTMQLLADGLDPSLIDEVAAYYASLPGPGRGEGATRTPSSSLGRTIATIGVPENGVPRCVACHGPDGGEKNPRYPRLAGQPAEYLALQLRLFAEGARGGTEYGPIMQLVASRLSQEEREAVAGYYASSGAGAP